jgi:hypothetical protein
MEPGLGVVLKLLKDGRELRGYVSRRSKSKFPGTEEVVEGTEE